MARRRELHRLAAILAAQELGHDLGRFRWGRYLGHAHCKRCDAPVYVSRWSWYGYRINRRCRGLALSQRCTCDGTALVPVPDCNECDSSPDTQASEGDDD